MNVWAFNIFCVPDTDDIKQNNKNHETIPSRFSLNRKQKRLLFYVICVQYTKFWLGFGFINIWTNWQFIWSGKVYSLWLLVREFKNHASRNHVSTSSCMLRIEKLVIFNMTMIDIDYYRLLSIIGLSINYVWWIECLEDNLERWAVWVFESMGKVGFSETLPWYR